jgi:hypothetical protein
LVRSIDVRGWDEDNETVNYAPADEEEVCDAILEIVADPSSALRNAKLLNSPLTKSSAADSI